MILSIIGLVALGGVVYAGYRYFKPKAKATLDEVTGAISTDVVKVESTVTDLKSEVVTAVNTVENVIKTL